MNTTQNLRSNYLVYLLGAAAGLAGCVSPTPGIYSDANYRYPIGHEQRADDRAAYQREIERLRARNSKLEAQLNALNEDCIISIHRLFLKVLDSGETEARSVKISVSLSSYLSYKSKSTHRETDMTDFRDYVTSDDPVIIQLAEALTSGIKTKEAATRTILNFCQYFPYSEWGSIVEHNNLRRPVETLVESGDCDNMAVLAASLMRALGIESALLDLEHELKQDGKNIFRRHFAVGVVGNFSGVHYELDGIKYFYAEATGGEWPGNVDRKYIPVGEVMKEFEGVPAKIYPLKKPTKGKYLKNGNDNLKKDNQNSWLLPDHKDMYKAYLPPKMRIHRGNVGRV